MISRVARKFSTKGFSPVKLPDLKWGYGDLQPVLSARLLEFHHGKHHQAYVNNVNATYEQILDAQNKNDHAKVDSLQKAFKFNLGGHINHSIFWENLAPISQGGGVLPGSSSALTQAITKQWGSYENFIAEFNKRAGPIQGSGWGWLGYDSNLRTLRLFETGNQDLPDYNGFVPLLTIDVWEHAYYLDYQNLRPKFLTEIWKVVNWKEVERRYNNATQ